MKKALMSAALIFGLANQYAVAGGSNSNFTETLPDAAAANSVPVSNGYDWGLTQRYNLNDFTLYTATTTVSDNLSSALSTMTVSGLSPVIPSAWFAIGKTMRITAKGTYSTAAAAHNWTWGVAVGTVTVVSSGASSPVLSQSGQYFSETAYLTTVTTGANGSMLGSLDVYTSSGTAPSSLVLVSSAPVTAVSGINMTNSQTVFPNFTWSNTASSMTVTNMTIELMN